MGTGWGTSAFTEVINAAKGLASNQKFQGEKHGTLRLPNGKYEKASFMGPGTKLIQRLKDINHNMPKTEVDKISMAHDLRYALTDNDAGMRAADNKMLESVAEVEREGTDSRINTTQAKLIKAKIGLEDMGLPKNFFTTTGGNYTMGEKKLMNESMDKLVQEGYGTKFGDEDIEKYKESFEKKPGEALYEKLVKRKKKKCRLPAKTKKRIRNSEAMKNKMEGARIPDDIMAALNNM